jgi:hypothetical protein
MKYFVINIDYFYCCVNFNTHVLSLQGTEVLYITLISKMIFNKPFFFIRKVKVYSTTSYKVVHSFDYTASILSLALAVSTFSSFKTVTNFAF